RASHLATTPAGELQAFTFISCAGLAMLAMLMVRAVVGAAGYRPYDAAIAAFSPLLVFHAFSNWDVLAMAFMACAMWAWAKRHPALCGAMIGLGTAAKLYPALLLIPLAVLAIRTRRYVEVLIAAIVAVAAWLAVNLPVALLWPHNWLEFYRFSERRPAERSSIWNIWEYLRTNGLDAGPEPYLVPNTGVAISLILAVALVVGLGLAAPRRPRLAQLTFLAVVAFLITTKVWSPQYSLWLVPLLALARPRWRSAIIWQCSEIAVWILTLLFLIGDRKYAVDYPPLMCALVVRDIILLVLCGLIVREMWRPELDVVRTDGARGAGRPDTIGRAGRSEAIGRAGPAGGAGALVCDDPGGGIFDGAPDYPLAILHPQLPPDPYAQPTPLAP
ncbi:MAG: glycosyltransferase 87 family protein, partial [Frankiaceae bacterium]|nr:glycosyltransferase 87 family protein [Frankiaceae bacterium]